MPNTPTHHTKGTVHTLIWVVLIALVVSVPTLHQSIHDHSPLISDIASAHCDNHHQPTNRQAPAHPDPQEQHTDSGECWLCHVLNAPITPPPAQLSLQSADFSHTTLAPPTRRINSDAFSWSFCSRGPPQA